jgi:hypothetical protein
MRRSFLKLIQSSLFLALIFGLLMSPAMVMAQDASDESEDSLEVVEDNSSAFNDSVQFDDMEPVFYEATDDEDEAVDADSGGMGGMLLYVGIAVVLIIVLIVLKKAGKKKA